MKLRVLLLCDRLDISGGVERFVCALANHLVTEGMDVAVGTVDTPRSDITYPLHPAIRVLTGTAQRRHVDKAHAPAAHRVQRLGQLLRAQWRIGCSLSRLTRQDRPDVVVLNALTTACSVLALDRRWASRTICCDHNHFTARSTLWQLLRRWLYRDVGAVVSLTEADASKFCALNARTVTIYNASFLRAEAPSLPALPLVLAVGRHVAQKGFDLLVQAWVQVAQALPQARLRIVGDGPLREDNECAARSLGVAERIEWLAPTSQVAQHYREAAVFVLPSRYEGMPLALLEAQAMGVPAVAFDCPTGPGEIITPDTGCLVPLGDVTGLAQALIHLLSSPELRAQMGHAAIVRSREVFSPQAHERQWSQLIRKVALQGAYRT